MKRRSVNRTMAGLSRLLLGIALPLLVLMLALNFWIVRYTGRESTRAVNETIHAQRDALENRLMSLGRAEAKLVIDYTEGRGELYSALSLILGNEAGTVERSQGVRQLSNAFSLYSMESGNEYRFFLCFAERGLYLPCDTRTGADTIGAEVLALASDGEAYSAPDDWNVVRKDGTAYLVRLMRTQNVSFGFWVTADGLVSSLESAATDELAVLTDASGERLNTISAEQESWIDRGGQSPFDEYLAVHTTFDTLPFTLGCYLRNTGVFRNLLWLQLGLGLLMALALIAVTAMFGYAYKHMLRPVQQFCTRLAECREDVSLDPDDYRIAELNQAGEQVNRLIDQVRHLKITLYEREMEQQRMQINFLKLQIKPHFYLNCLNLIYGMIDLEEYDQCRHMLRVTADYFRYLLGSDRNLAPVSEELEHVRNYLEIQSIRTRRGFSYYIEQDPETLECKIPPLILQTFVENSVKYSMSPDEQVEISVTVMPETYHGKAYANIFISDTGKGFPQEVLDQLLRGQSLRAEGGRRVGITNSLKRLKHCYGADFAAEIYNSPIGGAVVDLRIPISFQEASNA